MSVTTTSSKDSERFVCLCNLDKTNHPNPMKYHPPHPCPIHEYDEYREYVYHKKNKLDFFMLKVKPKLDIYYDDVIDESGSLRKNSVGEVTYTPGGRFNRSVRSNYNRGQGYKGQGHRGQVDIDAYGNPILTEYEMSIKDLDFNGGWTGIEKHIYEGKLVGTGRFMGTTFEYFITNEERHFDGEIHRIKDEESDGVATQQAKNSQTSKQRITKKDTNGSDVTSNDQSQGGSISGDQTRDLNRTNQRRGTVYSNRRRSTRDTNDRYIDQDQYLESIDESDHLIEDYVERAYRQNDKIIEKW